MIKKKLTKVTTFFLIYLFVFAVADILFSNFIYKQDIQNNCYKYTENFYYLKKNCYAKEKWLKNSLSYSVHTDNNGFRFSGKKNSKNFDKIVTFSGGSFTYGMGMDYNNTFVGMIESSNKELNIINLGLAGYSTSAFNYQLKKLISNKMYPKKIFVALDVLDVSNETSRWGEKIGYEHPVLIKKEVINVENIDKVKEFKRKNFKGSRLLARSVNNFFRYLRFYFTTLEKQPDKSIKTPWGSFLYTNIEDIDKSLWEPLSFEKGILKIKKNIGEISKLAQSINAEFYIIIYPWPDALQYGQNNFNWEEFADNLCLDVSCTKLINLFPDFRNIKENSKNWIREIYIKDDMHLTKFGHKIVSKKILKVGFDQSF